MQRPCTHACARQRADSPPRTHTAGNARGSLNRLPQTNKTFLSHSRSTSAAATPLNSRPSTVYSSHANSPPHTRRVHGPDADAGLPPSPHHHRTTITAQGERSAPPPAPAASAAATAAAVQQHVQLALGAPLTAPLPSYAAPLRGSLAPKRRMNEARPSTTMSATGGALLQNTLPPPALLGACKAWERDVPHPSDFTAATRSTRIHDVPAASKVRPPRALPVFAGIGAACVVITRAYGDSLGTATTLPRARARAAAPRASLRSPLAWLLCDGGGVWCMHTCGALVTGPHAPPCARP